MDVEVGLFKLQNPSSPFSESSGDIYKEQMEADIVPQNHRSLLPYQLISFVFDIAHRSPMHREAKMAGFRGANDGEQGEGGETVVMINITLSKASGDQEFRSRTWLEEGFSLRHLL